MGKLGVEQAWLKSLVSRLLQTRIWDALGHRGHDNGESTVLEG